MWNQEGGRGAKARGQDGRGGREAAGGCGSVALRGSVRAGGCVCVCVCVNTSDVGNADQLSSEICNP